MDHIRLACRALTSIADKCPSEGGVATDPCDDWAAMGPGWRSTIVGSCRFLDWRNFYVAPTFERLTTPRTGGID